MWACEWDHVTPDLMAIGKGFGGGIMPIGAVIGTHRTWQKYIENPFLHTTTFGGNPVCCAAAIATIHVLLEEDLPRQAHEKGQYMLQQINDLAQKYSKVLKLVRGRGLMLGMEFADNDIGYEAAKNLFSRQIHEDQADRGGLMPGACRGVFFTLDDPTREISWLALPPFG